MSIVKNAQPHVSNALMNAGRWQREITFMAVVDTTGFSALKTFFMIDTIHFNVEKRPAERHNNQS